MRVELEEANRYLLRTKRTAVRKLSLADAPFILELVNSPAWLRFIGNRHIHDMEAAEEYLKNGFLKYYVTPGYSYYLAETENEHPIGICGFLKKPNLAYEDLGFAFLERYQGQGYGFEVAGAIMAYGISQYKFNTLDAVTHIDNISSIGLLQKLGFQAQGIIDNPGATKSRLFRWQTGLWVTDED